MTVLMTTKSWRKKRPANISRRSADLSPEEQANVRKALRFLATRLGSWPKLAKAMGANEATVWAAGWKRGVSAGLAIRAARVAGESVESLLGGSWPREGVCPHCGRGD